jgi:hypothetical protein
MSTSPKLRITKSLIDSWLWAFKREDGWDDFLSTLHREKKPPTQAMLDGTRFENVLNNVLKGEAIPADHEWASVITEMSKDLQGSQQQVVLFSDCEVNGQPFLLHGVLDYLLAGSIWDCKFTKNYHLNKYFWEGTSQTAMYLALVPEARDFTYIISDGNYVYRERYPMDIVPPIEPIINNFMQYLKKHGLWEVYCEKWRVNN